MKKLYLILISLCLASTTLFAQTDNSFEIKFNIKGITAKQVYVNFFGQKDVANAEKINPGNGTFVFKGTTIQPVVARLFFSGQDQFIKSPDGNGYYPFKCSNLWLIVYPGANFSVTGSLEGKDFIDLYPVDGGENDYLAELNRKMMPVMNEFGNITVGLERNKAISEKEKSTLEDKLKYLEGTLYKIKADFINSRPNTIAALWLMEDMLIRSEITTQDLSKAFSKVDGKRFADNYFYASLVNRLDGDRNTGLGKVCPDISSNASADGSTPSLKDYRGKFVIIDFWGTWCGPCMSGVPHMKAFREAHKDKLEIFGVANDKDIDNWKSVLDKKGMNWPNILIGTGDKDYVAKFNVQGFPTKILVGPDGTILYRESGESEEFYKKVESMISK